MRGFTILLVVMSHVSTFILMQSPAGQCYSLNRTFTLFRMPLFFFVSGFVLYKAGRKWNKTETCAFLGKKIPVQILSPLVFMTVIANVFQKNFLWMLYDPWKGGYWFTFTLFEFFVVYILAQQALGLIRNHDGLKDALLLTAGLAASAAIWLFNGHVAAAQSDISRLLGSPHGHYFMYFVIGTLARKYYGTVELLLDKKYTTAMLMTAFFGLCLLPVPSGWIIAGAGLTGVFLVLSIFRRYRDDLGRAHRAGRVLQFVGRRTLDIYLIHYFFIKSNLTVMFPDFGAMQSPFAEFIVSFLVAVVIIACCLLVSAVIRTSPFMAHFLFGQKYLR